jgi:hypothetical protein
LNPATFTNKTYNVETLLIISIACCGSPKLSSEILMLRRNQADMDFKCRKKTFLSTRGKLITRFQTQKALSGLPSE